MLTLVVLLMFRCVKGPWQCGPPLLLLQIQLYCGGVTWPWGVDQVGAAQVPAPPQSWGQEGVGWVLPLSERTLHVKRES
jgi:hypothetical protein